MSMHHVKISSGQLWTPTAEDIEIITIYYFGITYSINRHKNKCHCPRSHRSLVHPFIRIQKETVALIRSVPNIDLSTLINFMGHCFMVTNTSINSGFTFTVFVISSKSKYQNSDYHMNKHCISFKAIGTQNVFDLGRYSI